MNGQGIFGQPPGSAAPRAGVGRDAAMQRAVALHQSGRLAEAEAAYRALLQQWPDFGEALNLHGVALSQLGRHPEATRQLARAAQLQPGNPLWRHNLGKALHDAGQHAAAEAEYRAALGLHPDFREAMFNLANLLKDTRRYQEAAQLYQRLLAKEPRHARALNNLGNTLGKLKRPAEAEQALRAALALNPGHADAHNNLGVILADQDRLTEAQAAYARALELRPGFSQVYLNRANTYVDQDRLEEALADCRSALTLEPRLHEAYTTLGNTYLAQGRLQESLASYRQALALAPEEPAYHFNLALACLLAGDFAQGWREYEWGLRDKLREPQRQFPQPRWDGRPFPGKTLLVVGEQGYGDVFQFLRYLPAAAARGGQVLMEVQQGLASLCARAFPNIQFVERRHDGAIGPAFDLHCHLMSLPHLFEHRREADIPAPDAYLAADPDKVRAWGERLAAHTGRRIGLVWAGNPGHGNDRRRSLALNALLPLTRLSGLSLFSLQKGEAAGQLAACPESGIVDLGSEIASFEDTAAILTHLELVISVDTSVVHLAGALGRPARVLLPFAPDWRWQLGREDSPWYPRLRLLRQTAAGRWETVVERLIQELTGH